MNQHHAIVLGGGCYWCLHSAYSLVRGITEVLQGYASGAHLGASDNKKPAEVVKISYNPSLVSLKQILDIFWTIHDPTSLNRQGFDVGEEYRSTILFCHTSQQAIIKKSLLSAQALWDGKVVTEVKPLDKFLPAEQRQYDYKNNRPDYCQLVINPKLAKLRHKFANLLDK